jgi:hypothetical protein
MTLPCVEADEQIPIGIALLVVLRKSVEQIYCANGGHSALLRKIAQTAAPCRRADGL